MSFIFGIKNTNVEQKVIKNDSTNEILITDDLYSMTCIAYFVVEKIDFSNINFPLKS